MWDKFMGLMEAQFRDPTIKEVHKRWMFDLHMGNNVATAYFQKLKEEAKLAG